MIFRFIFWFTLASGTIVVACAAAAAWSGDLYALMELIPGVALFALTGMMYGDAAHEASVHRKVTKR